MRRLRLVLFCEDRGHEAFVGALVKRLARDLGVPAPRVDPVVARGGHGKVLTELELWQKAVRAGVVPSAADGAVILIDGNGLGGPEQRRAVERVVDVSVLPAVVIGCPEPHVEAWCAADVAALQRVTGADVPPVPRKPGRGSFKRWLREALEDAGHPVLTDPMDIAADLLPQMDLFRAAKASPSLAHLIDGLRGLLLRSRGEAVGGPAPS
jgi:hypothetical protein